MKWHLPQFCECQVIFWNVSCETKAFCSAQFWKIRGESQQGTHLENLQSLSFHLSARNKGHYLQDIQMGTVMQLVESSAVNLGAPGTPQNRALF